MEDINAILKKAQSGDNEAISLILKEYSKLLSFNAQKYYLVGAEQEDLVQEGILGLLKAIKFYDETKSSFSSFAFLCIRREMISAIRKANTQKNMVLNEALKTNAILEDSANFDDEEHNINNYKSSEINPEEAYLLKEEIEDIKRKIELKEIENDKKYELAIVSVYLYSKVLASTIIDIQKELSHIKKELKYEIKEEDMHNFINCCGKEPKEEDIESYKKMNPLNIGLIRIMNADLKRAKD